MTETVEQLSLEIEAIGMINLAEKVRTGEYGVRHLTDNDLTNKLLFDLGGEAGLMSRGHQPDIAQITQVTNIANRIISGDFGKPAPAPAYNPLRMDAIWAVVTVEANGQEQFVRFLNSPLMTPDPDKVPEIAKIAAMTAMNGQDCEIVKFTVRESVEVFRAKDIQT